MGLGDHGSATSTNSQRWHLTPREQGDSPYTRQAGLHCVSRACDQVQSPYPSIVDASRACFRPGGGFDSLIRSRRCTVPWYFFTESWPDGKSENARTTSLSDEGHARRYAHLIIRELKARPDYRHTGQRMVVRSENGNMVHIISF